VSDAVDNALDSEDIEEEIEEEVDKVLTAIAGETAAELPEAVRKQKMNVPAQKAETLHGVRTLAVEWLQVHEKRWNSYREEEIKSEKGTYNVLQEDAIVEGVDAEEELEAIRYRLANVRS